jgi:hypothetical protein
MKGGPKPGWGKRVRLLMEYSIKKLPLKALKWAQFAGASRAHLPFTISFISYHIHIIFISYSYSNLVPFSTHDVFFKYNKSRTFLSYLHKN